MSLPLSLNSIGVSTPSGGGARPASSGGGVGPQTPTSGVYWVGQDGNVWYKTGTGTVNAGKPITTSDNGFDAAGMSGVGSRIADPLAPAGGSSSAPVSGSGGGGSSYIDTSAARSATQQNIDSLINRQHNMDASAQDSYDQLMKTYGQEDALSQQQYDDSVASNESTRSSNLNEALTAAAQGRQGLRSTLSGLNALNGTGALLADRAVASAANKDVGGANDAFDTNAKNLNTAEAQVTLDQKKRIDEASKQLQNAKTKNAATVATDRQGLFKDMASYFTQSGDNGSAASWLARIPGENGAIEAGDRVAAPSFQAMDAKFTPAATNNYLAGTQDMSVQTQGAPGGTAFNSPLFAATKKRDTPA